MMFTIPEVFVDYPNPISVTLVGNKASASEMDIFRTNGCKVVNVIHLIIKLHTHIFHVITYPMVNLFYKYP